MRWIAAKKQSLDGRQNCNSWGRLRQSLLQSSQLRKNCRIDLILATQRDNDRPLRVFAANQWNHMFKHDAKPAHQPSLFKQTIFWWITARLGKLKTGSATKACGPNCNPRGLNWNPLGPNYNPWGPNYNPWGPNYNPWGPNYNRWGPNYNPRQRNDIRGWKYVFFFTGRRNNW